MVPRPRGGGGGGGGGGGAPDSTVEFTGSGGTLAELSGGGGALGGSGGALVGNEGTDGAIEGGIDGTRPVGAGFSPPDELTLSTTCASSRLALISPKKGSPPSGSGCAEGAVFPGPETDTVGGGGGGGPALGSGGGAEGSGGAVGTSG